MYPRRTLSAAALPTTARVRMGALGPGAVEGAWKPCIGHQNRAPAPGLLPGVVPSVRYRHIRFSPGPIVILATLATLVVATRLYGRRAQVDQD
jgi:hypothetical protein